MLSSTANFMEERQVMVDYIKTLKEGEGLSEKAIREGYEAFKANRVAGELAKTAHKHGLKTEALQAFVDTIMGRMIFDGEQLSDLLAPLELGWKERTTKELALMADLIPLLKKLAQGREISGLEVYEN
jgi:type I restriction enzyme R subunit